MCLTVFGMCCFLLCAGAAAPHTDGRGSPAASAAAVAGSAAAAAAGAGAAAVKRYTAWRAGLNKSRAKYPKPKFRPSFRLRAQFAFAFCTATLQQ